MKNLFKIHPILKIMNSSFINLPAPSNLSYMWNFGSLSFMCLLIQIFSGLFLSMHYCPNMKFSFISIVHIMQNLNYGWMLRFIHMNGASLFFFFVFFHLGRGMYFHSWDNKFTWFLGVMIIFFLMFTSFLGYVLPWGQMSFWGATVITNLGSTIPYIGKIFVQWLWGGFSVGNPTLNRFYSLHFILPFLIFMLTLIHFMFLHTELSSNPLGMYFKMEKIPFYPYFIYKDLFMIFLTLMLFFFFVMLFPYYLGDSENFIKANSMVTPTHIQPEWYFLFAYSILRSIPNKLGGVMALIFSILILIIFPYLEKPKFKGNSYYMMNKIIFWIFLSNFICLTWIGMCITEIPFLMIGQISSMIYFFIMLNNNLLFKFADLIY